MISGNRVIKKIITDTAVIKEVPIVVAKFEDIFEYGWWWCFDVSDGVCEYGDWMYGWLGCGVVEGVYAVRERAGRERFVEHWNVIAGGLMSWLV